MIPIHVKNAAFDSFFKKKDITKWGMINVCTRCDINLFPFITLSNRKIMLVISLIMENIDPFRLYDEIYELDDTADAIDVFFHNMTNGKPLATHHYFTLKMKHNTSFFSYTNVHKYKFAFEKYVKKCDALGEKSASLTTSRYATFAIFSSDSNVMHIPVIEMAFVGLNVSKEVVSTDCVDLVNKKLHLVTFEDDDMPRFYVSPVPINKDVLY